MLKQHCLRFLTLALIVSSIVACSGSSENSSSDNTNTPTVDIIAPSKPTNLITISISASYIQLQWAASTDNEAVSGYRVYRNSVLLGTVTQTTYLDTQVSENTNYQYFVIAFDEANNTNASDIISVDTPQIVTIDITAPTTPGNLRASSSPTASSVNLIWDASTDNVAVTHYYVYRNATQIADLNTTTFSDNAVQPETSYQYRIAAADAAGNISTQGSILAVTTPASSAPVSFPRILVPIGYNCNDSNIHCVDDTGGANQEFSVIQDAVNVVAAGDTVIVHDGAYAGFTLTTSGTSDNNRVIITGNGNNVLINSGGSSQARVLVSNSDYVTIEGLTIEDANSYCLAARDASAADPMVGVTFQFNTVRNCSSSNIYMSHASYSLMLGNITYNSISSHGIYLSNAGSDNTIIHSNRSYNNAKNGLHFNGDSSNGGDGLHSNIVIDSNVFYNNTQSGVDADGLYDCLFVNNLIYGNQRHGIRGFQIDSSAGVARLNFINNTLANNGGWGIKLSEDIGGHVFFNNIIMNNAGGCIASGHSNLVSDKNIYSGSCGFSQDGEATTISYLTWASAYTETSVEAVINEVVSNTSIDDYTLATDSPAIDNGLASLASVSAPSEDIEGASRPTGGAIDIGAFEK